MTKAKETKQDIKKVHPVHTLTPFEEMDRFFESQFPCQLYILALAQILVTAELISKMR